MRRPIKRQAANYDWKAMGSGALAGGLAVFFFDPQRGKGRRAKLRNQTMGKLRRGGKKIERTSRFVRAETEGVKERIKHAGSERGRTYDDATLTQKVSTELFQHQWVPKGQININSHDGTVELRGQVRKPDEINKIERTVKAIAGVTEVRNLLHLEGTDAPS